MSTPIGDEYPKFTAAAVQASPVFLNRDATIDKVDVLVREAAEKGADLVVIGESFVPAFPLWNMFHTPMEISPFFKRMYENALEIPSPQFNRLSAIARRNKVFLSIGVTEKGPISMGALWNTNLLFDRAGRLLNRHRKLVPTWAEKLTWASGDASYLRVEHTEIGRIGALICGENSNPLARFALLAQGEQVHIATYPPAFPFKKPGGEGNYNLTESIRIRSAAHSFEGKVFNIVASGLLDADAIDQISLGDPEKRSLLEHCPPPVSLILGPTGELIAEPLVGKEGMIFADIDISKIIEQKQLHDVVGYYNRFDIFRFEMNACPNRPIWIRRPEGTVEEALAPAKQADVAEGPEREALKE